VNSNLLQGHIAGTAWLLLFMFTDCDLPRQLCVFGSALFAWHYVHAYACFKFTASHALTSLHLLVLQKRRPSVRPNAIPRNGARHTISTQTTFIMYCYSPSTLQMTKGIQSRDCNEGHQALPT